jgi:hypothetical protein
MVPWAAQRRMKMCAVKSMVPMSARRGRATLVFLNPHTSVARTLMRHNEYG